MSFAFLLQQQGSDVLNIDIASTIGESFWFDAVSAADVRRQLKASSAKTIRLWINSDGGDVFDAIAIYNQLVAHPARVEVVVGGIAASAASLIAMAGDSIEMGPGSWMMIHEAWGGLSGSPEELRAWADVLDRMSAEASAIYASRTGLEQQRVRSLMASTTWMTPEEALSMGFATSIAATKTAWNSTHSSALALSSHYPNMPGAMLEQLRSKSKPQRSEPQRNQLALPGLQPGEKNMNISKSITAALALVDAADETQIVAAITELRAQADAAKSAKTTMSKVEQLTGKAGEEALGVLMAWQESHGKLPTLQSELNTVREASAVSELASFLSGARDGSAFDDKQPRLTKAEADKLEEQITSGKLSLDAAKAFVEVKSPVSHLQGGPKGPESKPNAVAKQYRDMSNMERAELASADPALFTELRTAWERAGSPGPAEKAA